MKEAEQAKWYVIHTYSGYEAMVKDSLEKLIENNNLQDDIFEMKIPMEDTIEEKNGKRKVVQRKTLPCYVFIKLIYSNQVWFLVTNTRGVTGFVGPQGKPLPLTDDEVKRMRLENKVVEVNFEVGDTVNIISGALETFIGTVVELNNSNQKAKVNVSMFGRATDVEVDYIQIEKINA
jgi:transcriptional antiterminator NusG